MYVPKMVKALFATIAVSTAMVAGPATPAQAESCEAHIAKHHTTAAQDIAEHAAGIQPGESPCKGGSNKVDNSSSSDYDKDWHHSKWEDRTSFDCGFSWRGWGC
jgi:hypothetical protein